MGASLIVVCVVVVVCVCVWWWWGILELKGVRRWDFLIFHSWRSW